MSNLRILQLCQKPQRRGAELFAVHLAAVLERRGQHSTVSYLFDGPDADMAAGATILGGAEPPASRLGGLLPVRPRLLRQLERHLEEQRPDVVQLNGASTVKYGALCRRRHHPWALVYRNIGRPGDWVRGLPRRLFYRLAVMPAMDAVAAVSGTSLDDLHRLYDLDIPSAVLPTAVDLDALQPHRPREAVRQGLDTPLAAPVVIQVASLSPEKRPDRLLAAFSRILLQVPDARLWFLGDGPLRGELEEHCRAASEPALSRRVTFLGHRSDPATYLAAADLATLVSDTEGLPAAVLEAGALGLPVVATRVGGMAEAVEDGVTGHLVEPGDEDSLAARILELLRNPGERQRLGDAARRRVASRFDFEALAEGFLDLYRRALEHRRHRQGGGTGDG